VDVADDVARRELPVSEVDRWFGEYKVLQITSGWPFREGPREMRLPPAATAGERLAQLLYSERTDWPRAQEALRQHYREAGDAGAYTHVTQILAEAFPATATLQYEAAAALVAQGRTLDALRHARRAAALAPAVVNHWLVLGHALALLGRDVEAADALRRALQLEPGNATASAALAVLEARRAPSAP
jgi:Flp pilus assembly protein TadD